MASRNDLAVRRAVRAQRADLPPRPNDAPERRWLGRSGRHRSAYLWSVEPSTGVLRLVEVGPGRRPGVRARQSGRRACCRRRWWEPGWSRRAVFSDRVKGHGQPGFVPRSWRLGSPHVGCRVHTFVTPRSGVIMKPCGHDRGELNHVSRPHQEAVGHAVPELRRGRARHHAASVARQRISPSRRP